MPYLAGARGRLHYRRSPAGQPHAVLALLPGTGQHSGHYHRFGRALAAAGIELWTLDTSGHGLSEGDPGRPGTLPELAADARVFLDEIRRHTGSPLFLMGHSLGAATAAAVLGAATAPGDCAGLVLCGTPAGVFAGLPPASARGAEEAVPGSRRAGSRPVRGSGADRTGAADPGPCFPAGLPVVLVHGVDDRRAPVDPVREWAARTGTELREYADAGHDLLHEPVQARVTADIADWIRAHAAR